MSIKLGGERRVSGTYEKKEMTHNYHAKFTGNALVTPLRFNPNAADIKRIKNIPEAVQIKEPSYDVEYDVTNERGEVTAKKKYRKISILCSFKPSQLLPVDFKLAEGSLPFADEYFVNFEFNASSSYVFNKNRTSALIIDSKLNEAWIPIDVTTLERLNNEFKIAKVQKNESLMKSKEEAIKNLVKSAVIQAQTVQGDKSYGAPTLHLNSARPAREGEQPFIKFVFDMTDIRQVKFKTQSELAEMMTKAKSQEEGQKAIDRYKEKYEEFDLSDISSVFTLMLQGKYEEVNKIIFEDLNDIITSSSKETQCKVGVFLGVTASAEGALYQTCYAPKGTFGSHYTFKEPVNYVPSLMDKFTAFGVTVIPRNMAKNLTNPEYPYKDIWQDTFSFKVYELSLADIPTKSVELEPSVPQELFNTTNPVINDFNNLPF